MSTEKALEKTNQAHPEKTNTREKILETAIELFAEKGFNGTTTKEIAELMHLSAGTISIHRKHIRKKLNGIPLQNHHLPTAFTNCFQS